MTQEDFRQAGEPLRVRIPADLDTADTIFAGLSVRQLLVFSVFAGPVLLVWKTQLGHVSAPVLFTITVPVLVLGVATAMARRDGVSFDRWLISAIRYRVSPRHLTAALDLTPRTTAAGIPHEGRAVRGFSTGEGLAAPVAAVTEHGVIVLPDGRHVGLLACSTIANTLATHQDDATLAAGVARWLNSLSGPTQILIRNRPADLASVALDVAAQAQLLPHSGLAAAALDHAGFLLDIAEEESPLQRHVVVACSGGSASGADRLLEVLNIIRRGLGRRRESTRRARPLPNPGARVSSRAAAEAMSRVRRAAAELEGLGAEVRILDGAEVRSLLSSAWTPCSLATSPVPSGQDPIDEDEPTDDWEDDEDEEPEDPERDEDGFTDIADGETTAMDDDLDEFGEDLGEDWGDSEEEPLLRRRSLSRRFSARRRSL